MRYSHIILLTMALFLSLYVWAYYAKEKEIETQNLALKEAFKFEQNYKYVEKKVKRAAKLQNDFAREIPEIVAETYLGGKNGK